MKINTIIKYTVLVVVLFTIDACCAVEKEIMDRKLNYNGHDIFYEVRGNADETIVFIHGWSSSIQSWKYQLDNFKDYKVIAIDLRDMEKAVKLLIKNTRWNY